MNSNPKRNKNRPTIGSHNNPSVPNPINKFQSRPKPLTDRAATPEGVYFNGRVMHCTTSLIGCLVEIEVKDGTQYEGVLRTFSPEFELVIDYVTKIEANVIPISGTNIGSLLASLEANNKVSPTLIFQFPDVVKLNAKGVDLNFATNKGHMMTDSEISRFDSRHLSRDKELVPWDGSGDCEESLTELEEQNNGAVTAQNGWDPDDMFRTNEHRFQVKSTYDPNLKGYTIPLVKGEGEDYHQKERRAEQVANEIEGDSFRTDRYAKEDADDEEHYSAVVRPNDVSHRPDTKGQRNQRKNNSSQNQNSNYVNNNVNNSAGTPRSSSRSSVPSGAPLTASSAFHSNKNSNTIYNKQFSNTSSGSGANSGSGSTSASYKGPAFRDEPHVTGYGMTGTQTYSKADNEEPTQRSTPPTSVTAATHPQPLPQRTINENRRPMAANKRKEEMTADLKKFSNDFILPSGADTTSKDSVPQRSGETHVKHNTNSGISATKSKSPVSDSTPVKDKSETVCQQTLDDSSSDKRDSKRDSADSASAQSPTSGGADSEIAKKSTLNPNAKTFTPRQTLPSINSSATPPSVASTPSSTVSVPISGGHLVQQAPQHVLSHPQTHVGGSAGHASQPRFQNPLVQLQPQYNVLPPGLTLPLGPNQYLIQNVAAMAPTFAQSNHTGQQRTYRTKGPQQYSNHGIRHDFTQQSAHVAAAVTGHPVLATAPIGAPQQIPVSYGPQQTTAMVAPQGPPQHMYHNMYGQFQRMNVFGTSQHSPMQMAVPQVQYDPTQLQHIYATNAVQLQHLVSQAHQHMTNSGPHSGHSTPQSATPTTPMHGPAPSPVHHQPNQPPTPTPQQTVMYANVSSPHNPQNAGHHSNTGAPYPNIVILPTGPPMSGGHHSGGHSANLHQTHALSHSSTQANHHSGAPTAILPVQLISSSNAAQNPLAFNTNAGV